MADRKKSTPEAPDQSLVVVPQHQRPSRDLIYESMMRAGGESFGAPFNLGTSSLTEKIVAKFKQRGFFGFETLERKEPPNQNNKFTRQGAAPYRGSHRRKREP